MWSPAAIAHRFIGHLTTVPLPSPISLPANEDAPHSVQSFAILDVALDREWIISFIVPPHVHVVVLSLNIQHFLCVHQYYLRARFCDCRHIPIILGLTLSS